MPNLLDSLSFVTDLASSGPLGVIVDIDGTISPIASSPELARVTPGCKRSLRLLSRLLPLVAAVSGRPAREARRLVGVPGMVYVGNHGLERWEKGKVIVDEAAKAFHRPLREALDQLRSVLNVPGVLIEDKGATGSIHYRLTSDPAAARKIVLAEAKAAAARRGLRVTEGRMVVEIRPPVDIDKGTAVMRLVEDHGLKSVIYLGDDATDIDAFEALHAWQEQGKVDALSIAVLSAESGSRLAGEADAYLNGVGDVERFLGLLVSTLSRPASTGPQAGDKATS